MDDKTFDVLVIGGGHAGLSISYHLTQHKLNHLIFERGKIGSSWRSQRWDSFKLNTANKVNLLPGEDNIFPDPDGFCSASEFASFLEGYAKRYKLPIREQCKVTAIEKAVDSELFSVSVCENGVVKIYRTNQVVIASGSQNEKNIPAFAKNISSDILQLHTSEYKNATCLPTGCVLIVGTAQSGTQVAEDLIDAGRKVFVSTSQVSRIPRRYRDKDIVDWFIITGFYDMRIEDITDLEILKLKQPQVSGVGLRGRTLSLQGLAKKGAVIFGKMENTITGIVFLLPNAASNVLFGDESSKKIKNMIDSYISKSQHPFSLPELDTADLPDDYATCVSNITELNLRENNVTSIIWATGFSGDFSYLKLPVFNDDGTLKHRNGVSEIKGLYFIGLPWLRKRKSGIIFGIKEDAEYLTQKILQHFNT
jgi:putative flavoprotein involved in K+ transport